MKHTIKNFSTNKQYFLLQLLELRIPLEISSGEIIDLCYTIIEEGNARGLTFNRRDTISFLQHQWQVTHTEYLVNQEITKASVKVMTEREPTMRSLAKALRRHIRSLIKRRGKSETRRTLMNISIEQPDWSYILQEALLEIDRESR